MRRLFALLLGLVVAAALPLNASADDTLQAAIMEAKFMSDSGAPDLAAEQDTPIAGDADPIAAARAFHGNGRGVQVNDPALDHINFFPNALPQPQRPYEFAVQSETTIASFGRNVVVGFNNSADQPVFLTPQNRVSFTHRFLSGVGVSHDGGRTFTETSLPPTPGSIVTFGDPALAVDRSGNFFYASLGADANFNPQVFVGKSTDGGTTFAPGVTVALDNGVDKEWIAAGPDPTSPSRDNVYVTWTSFGTGRSDLMLGRSTDGGQTWTTSNIFAPVNANGLRSFIQFSNPVVDRSTGTLYVPFLNAGAADADFFRVLASNDGGLTFHLLNFNVPGAPDPQAFPNVTPGTIVDCGSPGGGFRLVLHSGPNLGGGRLGLPRFQHATRLVSQPSFAATNGNLFIAYNASNSAIVGDPNSTSDIRLLVSHDAGASWSSPITVAAASANNPQHVHPAISVSSEGEQVSIGYYTQLSSGQLQVDAVRGEIGSEDGVATLEDRSVRHLSPTFDLTPSMNPNPAFGTFATTNFDRTIVACYDIGEYMGATRSDESTLFTWGDNRNSWTSPPQSPAAGTHSQPDVFAKRVGED